MKYKDIPSIGDIAIKIDFVAMCHDIPEYAKDWLKSYAVWLRIHHNKLDDEINQNKELKNEVLKPLLKIQEQRDIVYGELATYKQGNEIMSRRIVELEAEQTYLHSKISALEMVIKDIAK